jgi:hypothetical protein
MDLMAGECDEVQYQESPHAVIGEALPHLDDKKKIKTWWVAFFLRAVTSIAQRVGLIAHQFTWRNAVSGG